MDIAHSIRSPIGHTSLPAPGGQFPVTVSFGVLPPKKNTLLRIKFLKTRTKHSTWRRARVKIEGKSLSKR
jgi:hypothetical protein